MRGSAVRQIHFQRQYQELLSSEAVHFSEKMSNRLAIALAQKCVPKEEKALKYCLVGSAPVTAAGNLQLTLSCAVTEMFCYFRYSCDGMWEVPGKPHYL